MAIDCVFEGLTASNGLSGNSSACVGMYEVCVCRFWLTFCVLGLCAGSSLADLGAWRWRLSCASWVTWVNWRCAERLGETLDELPKVIQPEEQQRLIRYVRVGDRPTRGGRQEELSRLHEFRARIDFAGKAEHLCQQRARCGQC